MILAGFIAFSKLQNTYNYLKHSLGEGGCLQIITLNVTVSNTTTVKVITEGDGGFNMAKN